MKVSRLAVLMAIAVLGTLAATMHGAQQPAPQQDFSSVQVRSFKVQDNVYMLVGAGGNVTLQMGDDGVLVVDTQFAPMADKLLAEIARISGNKPIRYVVNTHVHADHIGGNERFRRAGNAIVAGNVAFDVRGNRGALIIAHENVQRRMAQPEPNETAAPAGAMPTDTFFEERDEVFFNGEAVELLHQPAAHTDGDILVFFRKSDVVSTGDIFITTGYPLIDRDRGGTINGILAGLNHIIELTVPRDKQEGGTMVIPGHGRISDEADVVEYRDMLTIIRDRVQEMVKKGMTLDQVKSAKPTSDYDGRYGRVTVTPGVPAEARAPGSTSEGWTTDMFIEALYRTLGGRS